MAVLAQRHQPTGLVAHVTRGPPSPLLRCLELVGAEMLEAEAALSTCLQSAVPAVSGISLYLVQAGGKRLRPMITALGARAAGHRGDLVALMCAGEVLHLGSLLHDDVVDGATERRGLPAAHRQHGNAATVLAGDFCLARAVLLAAEGGGHRPVEELARVVTRMAEGEVQQLLAAGDLEPDLDRYFEIIERKCADLIAWCAAAGAWAMQDADAASALHLFGREVGIAFQLTDDVLDYRGDPRVTGKQPGADLLERKPTLPLLYAMERRPGLRERLLAGAPEMDELPLLLEQVRGSGACEHTLAEARRRVERGQEALSALAPGPYRDALDALALHIVERVQ